MEKGIMIGEAINMIIENHSLEFVSGDEELLYYHSSLGVVVRNVFEGVLYPPNLTPSALSNKWLMAVKPVSFNKACQEGGKIKVKHKLLNALKFSGYYDLGYLMKKLSDEHSTPEIREILITGDFYLE